MAADGESVRAHKPVVTGLDVTGPDVTGPDITGPDDRPPDDRTGEWPPDHELLAAAAGMAPEEVAPLRYGPAVSPQLAAQLAGQRIDPVQLLAAVLPATANHSDERSVLVVEGVGGLLTPLAENYAVRDFAAAIGLPVLVAARPGLGTINHTLLTLQAARAAGLDVRAVVLTPWPQRPSQLERSNRETIARMGDVEVETLSRVHHPDPALLGRAGAGLPWRRWLR
jgi:dethiobiotin synthetase